MSEDKKSPETPVEGTKPHGDPLLSSATGHPDGDGSRHGFDVVEESRQGRGGGSEESPAS